jgi:hypothetical protein
VSTLTVTSREFKDKLEFLCGVLQSERMDNYRRRRRTLHQVAVVLFASGRVVCRRQPMGELAAVEGTGNFELTVTLTQLVKSLPL